MCTRENDPFVEAGLATTPEQDEENELNRQYAKLSGVLDSGHDQRDGLKREMDTLNRRLHLKKEEAKAQHRRDLQALCIELLQGTDWEDNTGNVYAMFEVAVAAAKSHHALMDRKEDDGKNRERRLQLRTKLWNMSESLRRLDPNLGENVFEGILKKML